VSEASKPRKRSEVEPNRKPARERVIKLDPAVETVLLVAAVRDPKARASLLSQLADEDMFAPLHRRAWSLLRDADARGLDLADPSVLRSLDPSAADVVNHMTGLLGDHPEVPGDLSGLVALQREQVARAAIATGPLTAYSAAMAQGRPLAELHALAGALDRAHEGASRGEEELGEFVGSDWYEDEPERQEWLLRDRRAAGLPGDADGVLEMGITGVIAAAGGVGKSSLWVSLAVAVATGSDWLGVFSPPARPRGKVFVGLFEEKRKQARRMLYRAAKRAGKHPPRGSIFVAPMHGKPCAFLRPGEKKGELVVTEYFVKLASFLRTHGPWCLVLLDPQSRIAGPDAEVDNSAATVFVQLLERLSEAAGGAVVLWSAHTPDSSRKEGARVKARGVSALEDAARFVLEVSVEEPKKPKEGDLVPLDGATVSDAPGEEIITVRVKKNSYARKPEPVLLRRDLAHHGMLVPLSSAEQDEHAAAKAVTPAVKKKAQRTAEQDAEDAKVDATILAVVAERPGIPLRDLLDEVQVRAKVGEKKVGLGIVRVRPQLDVRTGPRSAKLHHLAAPSSGECDHRPPPHTPPSPPRTEDGRGPSVLGRTRGQTRTDEDGQGQTNGIFPSTAHLPAPGDA